jgi:hypothetical protein
MRQIGPRDVAKASVAAMTADNALPINIVE